MFSEASVVVVEYQMTQTRKFLNLGDASGVWETYRGEVGFAMRDHEREDGKPVTDAATVAGNLW